MAKAHATDSAASGIRTISIAYTIYMVLLVRVLLNAKHAAVVVGVTLFHVQQRVLPHPTRSHTVSMCASWHILKGMHSSPRGYLLKSVTSYKKLSKNLSGTNLLELFFLNYPSPLFAQRFHFECRLQWRRCRGYTS